MSDPAPSSPPAALEVSDLRVSFFTPDGEVPAVRGVHFQLRRGRTLALVGESGSGKSVTGYALLRLVRRPGRIVGGSIRLHSQRAGLVDIAGLPDRSPQLYRLRGGLIGMIFQEPMSSLSPVHSVGEQVAEAFRLHSSGSRAEARARTIAMLGRVGLEDPERQYRRYPHELSGGMRQRVVIAMALVARPEVLIADEPTTALDATLQAQILALLRELQAELGCAVLMITHDFAVVARAADEVAVMYLGRIVESGPAAAVIQNARHPYTRGLLASIPSFASGPRLASIRGSAPSPREQPAGCPFHPRCPYAHPGRCDQGGPPALRELAPGHAAACVRAEEIAHE